MASNCWPHHVTSRRNKLAKNRIHTLELPGLKLPGRPRPVGGRCHISECRAGLMGMLIQSRPSRRIRSRPALVAQGVARITVSRTDQGRKHFELPLLVRITETPVMLADPLVYAVVRGRLSQI